MTSSNGQSQRIETTNERPASVEELGMFVTAAEVKAGQNLNELPGGSSQVIESRQERLGQAVTVYNFRLAEGHPYFVREAGSKAEPVWVHNEYNVLENAEAGRAREAEAARQLARENPDGVVQREV